MNHAYLIIAHNEFGILKKLVKLLDCSNNDIYIHIDKKIQNFNFMEYEKITDKANLFFVPRIKISWSGFSQIQSELSLIKEAVKNEYDYYHLISGVDLPLKSNEFIDIFFEKNKGKEFILFEELEPYIYKRAKYYHFLREFLFKRKKTQFLRFLNELTIIPQMLLGINRLKRNNLEIKKGSSWFSITHSFAKFICENEEFIHKNFKYTSCADELFLHTLVHRSSFKNSIVDDNYRYIDWVRGRPYTFKKEDYQSLINSNKLWARKFSEKIDMEIVEDIYKTIITANKA
ncbi:MAG: beta-1,6-N-acetylglucosaminyltransferase [Fibromonadaceae bacterium]|jgi:hypothetical protein|nr:beta-1,6-N-acetylglucosaminyltransferase [Fibromonadaceae bacterium]